jgi:hypothetical protein
MVQQNMPSTALQSEALVTLKLPYAPPQATFVPLKLEERLLACDKKSEGICGDFTAHAS